MVFYLPYALAELKRSFFYKLFRSACNDRFSFYPHNKNLPQCRSSTPQEVLIYLKLSILILPNANRRCRDKHRAYSERALYACVRVSGGIVRAARTIRR